MTDSSASFMAVAIATLVLASSGCLSNQGNPTDGIEGRVDVTGFVNLSNDGTKALSYWVNLTNESKIQIAAGKLAGGATATFVIEFQTPGRRNLSVAWFAAGEELEAPAAGTLASDGFHEKGGLVFDPAECEPGSRVFDNETAEYYNQSGPAPEAFPHGLRAHSDVTLCEPRRGPASGTS